MTEANHTTSPVDDAAPAEAPETVQNVDPTPGSRVDRLIQEKSELQDLLQRRQAEFENFRRRVTREKAEISDFVTQAAVESLLGTLDDFERALKVDTSDKDYAKGMELIYTRLYDQLKKLGLEPIESVGKPFDPHVHHAVEKVPADEGVADDTVIGEFVRGYNFKGRLLRPAMVKVAVHTQA